MVRVSTLFSEEKIMFQPESEQFMDTIIDKMREIRDSGDITRLMNALVCLAPENTGAVDWANSLINLIDRGETTADILLSILKTRSIGALDDALTILRSR
jgi:hypothetical protein